MKVVKKRDSYNNKFNKQMCEKVSDCSSPFVNLNNMRCSFSNYEKILKCNNNLDDHDLDEQDDFVRPFCEEHFEVPIRGELSEFLTIKLRDRENELGELRLKMSDII